MSLKDVEGEEPGEELKDKDLGEGGIKEDVFSVEGDEDGKAHEGDVGHAGADEEHVPLVCGQMVFFCDKVSNGNDNNISRGSDEGNNQQVLERVHFKGSDHGAEDGRR